MTLRDATSRSGDLTGERPSRSTCSLPELPTGTNVNPETTLRNYTNAWFGHERNGKAAGALRHQCHQDPSRRQPRLAASSWMVARRNLRSPVVFGYLGFDCAILRGLSASDPDLAVLDPAFNPSGLLKSNPVYAQMIDKAVYQGILPRTGEIPESPGCGAPPRFPVIHVPK